MLKLRWCVSLISRYPPHRGAGSAKKLNPEPQRRRWCSSRRRRWTRSRASTRWSVGTSNFGSKSASRPSNRATLRENASQGGVCPEERAGEGMDLGMFISTAAKLVASSMWAIKMAPCQDQPSAPSTLAIFPSLHFHTKPCPPSTRLGTSCVV